MTVYAFGDRTSNADLVVDLAEIGYFPGSVLDVTYGLGRWWSKFCPEVFVGCDLVVEKSPLGVSVDFTDLPFGDCSFDTVVFDPPYKLNGRSGEFAGDDSYGVGGSYVSAADRLELIYAGVDECCRVASKFVVLKCQDQVTSGRMVWQTRLFSDRAELFPGVRLVDSLMVRGFRKQPGNKRQLHAHRDYSTALVFRKGSGRG